MRLALLALAWLAPLAARAAGGHDALGCAGCHSTHLARGDALSANRPNTALVDPRTGKPSGSITALCLSCHADTEAGGRGAAPISNHFNHPYSVARPNPRLAQVPPGLLREGRFECVGCHDPHPSNPNYRYLRIAVTRSPSLAEFCSLCHPRKVDRGAGPRPLFDSMDEGAPRPAALPPAAPP